jgi:DNA-binding GntR family transcriptional regulator
MVTSLYKDVQGRPWLIPADPGRAWMPSVIFVPVNHDAATPLWRQLADELRADIRAGKLPSGRVMPSETTLMQTHGLARGTVRKAIDTLQDEGLVVRVQGRGTYVV